VIEIIPNRVRQAIYRETNVAMLAILSAQQFFSLKIRVILICIREKRCMQFLICYKELNE
jgi:hypothetical protein